MMEKIMSYILAIIGFILAYIFYKLSRKEKRPLYVTKNIPIIGQQHATLSSDIKIFYKERLINQVSICRIAIENNGKALIDKGDIVSTDPLKIIFDKDIQILSVKIIKISRDPINFKITEIQKNIINFTFDFLDKNDKAIFEVIYDGEATIKPVIKGTIKGATKGFEDLKSVLDPYSKTNTFLSIFIILLGIFMFIGAFLQTSGTSGKIDQFFESLDKIPVLHVLARIFILVFAFGLIIGGFYLYKDNKKSKKYRDLFL